MAESLGLGCHGRRVIPSYYDRWAWRDWKGSLSLRLKRTLGWHVLDSGALYRHLLSAFQKSISTQDQKELLKVAQSIDVIFR